MKILQLTSLKCGGAESVLINYFKNIDRSALDFDFFTISDEEDFYDKTVRELNGKVFKVSPKNKFINAYKALSKLNKTNNYTAIEIHTENAHSVIWVLLAKVAGFKNVIIHSHSTSNVKIIQHRICKFFLNLFHIYRFSCGEEASTFMFGEKQSLIVNNAIDLNKFKIDLNVSDHIKKEYNIQDKKVIGHVGRFIELKNQKFIVEILEILNKKYGDYFCIFLGDGELKSNVEEFVNEKKLTDNVIFAGNVSNVHEYMQAMDVFLLPSFFEGMPTVCIEAQACSLPCIVSDTITRKVNKTGNVLFLDIHKSAETWADKIYELSSNSKIDQREKMMLSGFDIKKEAIKLIEAYRMIEGNNEKGLYALNN